MVISRSSLDLSPAKTLAVSTLLVDGAVRAFRESVEGREQVIHVERAGATIAELPVFYYGAYPPPPQKKVRPCCSSTSATAPVVFGSSADRAGRAKLLAGRLRKCAELVEALSLREVDPASEGRVTT